LRSDEFLFIFIYYVVVNTVNTYNFVRSALLKLTHSTLHDGHANRMKSALSAFVSNV